MPTAYILSLAILCSSFTITRGQDAVGITDYFLAIACGISIAAAIIRNSRQEANPKGAGSIIFHEDAAASSMLYYWCFATLLLVFATLANYQAVEFNGGNVLFSLTPYLLNLVVIFAVFLEVRNGAVKKLLYSFVVFSFFLSAIYVVLYLVGPAQFFYYNRFAGFSENPNQTALQALSMIIVSQLVLEKYNPKSTLFKIASYLTIALTIIFGISTLSDAFAFALLGVGASVGARVVVVSSRYSPMVFTILLMGSLFIALATYIVLQKEFDAAWVSIVQTLQSRDQDTVRFLLWQHGIDAWRENMLIGNGPGGWSGISQAFSGKEAHNSFIDWLTISGLVGVFAYLWLISRIKNLKFLLHASSYFSLLALVLFSLFHFTFRLPIYWITFFVVLIPHVASASESAIRNKQNQRLKSSNAGSGSTRRPVTS